MIKLNIQMFAEAGTLVNTTGANLVNAYTAGLTAYGTYDLTPGMKTYYDTMMLENARENLVLTQLGKSEPLPQHKGKIIEWRKWNTLPDADVLVEGVIPEGKTFGQTSLNVTVVSQGLYVAITSDLDIFHVDPVFLGATEEVGASVGRSMEKVVRAALQLSANVLFCDALNTTSSHAYVSTPASRIALSAAAATLCALSPDMVAQGVTVLQNADAPFYDGAEYLGVMHPSVWYDLRRNPEWIDVHKYEASREIFNGEVGELHGVRFLKSTIMPIIKGANLTAASRNLTVAAAGVSAAKLIPVEEAITEAEATALAGRKLIISGVQYTVDTAAAGEAGAATVTTLTNVTAAHDVVIYPGEGGALGTAIYQTFIMGKDAFAVIKPDGASMETIIHDRKSGIGGPLNQFGTVGGVFTTAAKILYPERIVVIESCSKYSATAVAN